MLVVAPALNTAIGMARACVSAALIDTGLGFGTSPIGFAPGIGRTGVTAVDTL